MPTLRRCEVWSSFACDSGARQAVLALQDCAALTSTERITREDVLTLTIPKASSAAEALALGRVLRLAYDDESFDEWRIHEIVDQSGRDGGRYRVTCRGVAYELRDLALLASTTSGILSTAVSYDGKTATEIIDALLAYLPAWWARGTVTPTTAVSFTIAADATPLKVLRTLVAQLNASRDACELTVRRNGTTGYYIDLPAAIGISADVPDIRTAKNILTSDRTRSREPMVNRLYPRGSDGCSLEYAYVRVASVSGSDVELRQAETGAPIVVFDDQYVGLYLENDAGTRTQITDSVASASTVTVASATGFAADEWCRVVADSSGNGLTYVDYPPALSHKVAVIEDAADGTTNLVNNPYLSRWTGSTSAPPTGWNSGGGTVSRNATTTFIRRGSYSLRLQGTNASSTVFTTTVNVLPGRGTTYCAMLDVYKVTVGVGLTIALCNQAGTVISSVSTGTGTGWYSAVFTGINISTATGLFLRVTPPNITSEYYVDSAQITVGASQAPWTLGSGPASLMRRALVYLEDNAFDPTTYTLTLADLHRWSPVEWPYDAFALGATVNITDTELGIATSSRITEITRDYLNPLATTLVLERTTRTLTTTLAAAA